MHYLDPYVRLLTHTINPLQAIYRGFKTCTSPIDNIELPPIEEMEDFVRKRLRPEHAHESVLEHAAFTFDIVCSRATSHQFVRHRIASYSQQSQRYCRYDELELYVPESILMDDECFRRFDELHLQIEDAYRFFVGKGIKPEDARYVLTQANFTRMQVSMNCRSLRNFFAERLCRRAQSEIRQIAWSMLDKCMEVLPCVFEDIAEPCVKAGHCVEERSCGEAPWRKA